MTKEFLAGFQFIKAEKKYDDRILVVTLSRPPVNAFIKESYEELSSIIHYANNDPEICVVLLKSDQRIFSAGADGKKLREEDRNSVKREMIYTIAKCH